MEDVYTIVPFGVEDLGVLTATYGIGEGSVDCVVCCQVLCSVPQPQVMVGMLWRLLRSGGRMLVFEHVKAVDGVSRRVQGLSFFLLLLFFSFFLFFYISFRFFGLGFGIDVFCCAPFQVAIVFFPQ